MALDQHTDVLRCEQCGREGTSGFTVYPALPHLGVERMVVCQGLAACARRRRRG